MTSHLTFTERPLSSALDQTTAATSMRTVPSRCVQVGCAYGLHASRCAASLRQLRGLTSTTRSNRDSNVDTRASFPGFVADAMDVPLRLVKPRTKTMPAPPPPDKLPMTEEEERLAKMRIVFGSRLAGPGQRRREIEQASTVVAGITVPPKPEEPDNCCMSGCVNCVWDQFREEFEEWAAKSAEARAKLLEQRQHQRPSGASLDDPGMPGHVADTADTDGGSSAGLWSGPNLQPANADLFADIPVGIREFMKTEKKLKERRAQAQTASA